MTDSDFLSHKSSLPRYPMTGSRTPRPKTISARDSSAQINFFTGTPRPGTRRPSYKILYLWHTMEYKCTHVYLVCFYFNIRFSTIGKRNVKKECIFSYKLIFFFTWDISAWETSAHLYNNLF